MFWHRFIKTTAGVSRYLPRGPSECGFPAIVSLFRPKGPANRVGMLNMSQITRRYHGSLHRTGQCSQWSGVHVCSRKRACDISQQSTISRAREHVCKGISHLRLMASERLIGREGPSRFISWISGCQKRAFTLWYSSGVGPARCTRVAHEVPVLIPNFGLCVFITRLIVRTQCIAFSGLCLQMYRPIGSCRQMRHSIDLSDVCHSLLRPHRPETAFSRNRHVTQANRSTGASREGGPS